MKNFLFIIAVVLISACSKPKTEETATINHIYKPTYTDNFKIGDSKNALIVEEMHKAMIAKDFKAAADFLSDSIVFRLGTGTSLSGKPAILALMEKEYSQINIKNYKVQVNLPVVGENGEEWVLLWDNADIETPDGKSTKGYWMEAFQFKNGKIVTMEQFEKYPIVK